MTPTHIQNEALAVQAAAQDFRDECDAIAAILEPLSEADFSRLTQFKSWSINDIIGHLHIWNIAADLTAHDPQKFGEFLNMALSALVSGQSHPEMQAHYFGDLQGLKLFNAWREFYPALTTRYEQIDPAARLKWAGPDMSAQACIIARQMEHWAHTQALYDLLGLERQNHDRIKNIAHLGVLTYSWSFRVQAQEPPKPKPYVRLRAPSGAIWVWNEVQDDNQVSGEAEQFCQVVTQCRNVKDTQLEMHGAAANAWMARAQCFAGGSETPPPKGSRYRQSATS